jgi:hypothetical protein
LKISQKEEKRAIETKKILVLVEREKENYNMALKTIATDLDF